MFYSSDCRFRCFILLFPPCLAKGRRFPFISSVFFVLPIFIFLWVGTMRMKRKSRPLLLFVSAATGNGGSRSHKFININYSHYHHLCGSPGGVRDRCHTAFACYFAPFVGVGLDMSYSSRYPLGAICWDGVRVEAWTVLLKLTNVADRSNISISGECSFFKCLIRL